MPRRTVRLITRKRAPLRGGCRTCSSTRRRTGGTRGTRGRHRLKNAHVLRKWITHRANPWMVRGRGFFKDLWKGFKTVIKPVASIAGPVLDVLGMPEFGMPLAAIGDIM